MPPPGTASCSASSPPAAGGREQPRAGRAARRLVDREERLLHREQPQQQPTFALPSAACSQNSPLVTISPTVVTVSQRAPVEHVGQRAALQTEDHERDQPEHPVARRTPTSRFGVDLRRPATTVSCAPTTVTMCAVHRRRKCALRSGRVSARRPDSPDRRGTRRQPTPAAPVIPERVPAGHHSAARRGRARRSPRRSDSPLQPRT